MKRVCIFFTAFILISSSVFSASKKIEGKISKIKPAQTKTLTVVLQPGVDDVDYIIAQKDFAQNLLQKLNVELNVVKVESETETPSGDILVYPAESTDYTKACTSGILLDWEKDDLVQTWAPYLLNNKKVNIQKNKFLDSPDRTIHGYSPVGSEAAFYLSPYTWEISSEVYEEAETPKVLNLNNYVEVLLQGLGKVPKPVKADEIAEEDGETVETAAETIPEESGELPQQPAAEVSHEATNFDYDFTYVKDMIAAYYGADFFNYGFYNPVTKEFIDLLANDGPYLSVLRFLNKLAQKDVYAKDYLNIYLNNQPTDVATPMTTVIPEAAQILVYEQNKYGGPAIWSVSADSANKELCIALINWLGFIEPKATLELEPNYILLPQTLYQPLALTEDVSEIWTEVIKPFETETVKIINAKDDEECEKLIADLSTQVRQAGYDKCITFTNKLLEKRKAAENVAKGKIK